jgi:hypothetical protein
MVPVFIRSAGILINIFPQPSFRDSPFLYPVFAIITGILKHLFTGTEPPSTPERTLVFVGEWPLHSRYKFVTVSKTVS